MLMVMLMVMSVVMFFISVERKCIQKRFFHSRSLCKHLSSP